jgi:hypothetical protein
MGRDVLVTRLAPLRALSASVACLVGASGLGCQREAVVAGSVEARGPARESAREQNKDAAPTGVHSASSAAPSVPKRGSCHRLGPLACEEAPAVSGPEFVKHLHTCLVGYRELNYGRIVQVTGAERLDRGAGNPGAGVGELAAFAVTARFGTDAEPRTARSVYLAAEYGDGLCLVDQLMFPRDSSLPCREQLRFLWQPAPAGTTAQLGLIVETETVCSYAQGVSRRCASAEYRVSDGKFWIVRETDREGACSS